MTYFINNIWWIMPTALFCWIGIGIIAMIIKNGDDG